MVVMETGALMVSANAFVGFAPPGSDTPIVKLNAPFTEGVPLSTPVAEFSVTPAGSVPVVTAHVSVPSPPVAASVVVYAAPCTPCDSGDAVVIVSAAFTARLIVDDAKLLPVSVARKVMLFVPDAVGDPVMAPVEVFSESPACSAPAVMLHVYPPSPPVAFRV